MKISTEDRLYQLTQQIKNQYNFLFESNNIRINRINLIRGDDDLIDPPKYVNTIVYSLKNHSESAQALELLLENKIDNYNICSINVISGLNVWQIKIHVYLNDNEIRKLKIKEIF